MVRLLYCARQLSLQRDEHPLYPAFSRTVPDRHVITPGDVMRRIDCLLIFSLVVLTAGIFSPTAHAQLDSAECSTTEAWLPAGLGTPAAGYVAAVDDNILYVAYSSDRRTYSIASWDGAEWLPVTTLTVDGGVFDMICYNHQLYLRGDFTSVNGLRGMVGMARWDGKQWRGVAMNRMLPWALPEECGRMAVYKGELYVSGYFDTGNDTGTYNGIGAWNGTVWRKIVDSRNSSDSAAGVDLVVKDGYLYAGGDIDSIDGVVVKGVARYDGVTWSRVGTLDLYGTRRLIPFANAIMAYCPLGRGYLPRDPVYAVWDGTSWKGIPGASTPEEVFYPYVPPAIAGFEGEVYMMYRGVPDKKVKFFAKKWNGSSWQHLAKPDGQVNALVQAGDLLYAAGSFGSSCNARLGNVAALYKDTSIAGTITGKVYRDHDGDCTQGPAEEGLAGLLIRSGGSSELRYAITRDDGGYTLPVPVGSSSVEVMVPRHRFVSCPKSVGRTVVIARPGDVSAGNDFAVRDSAGSLDLSMSLTDIHEGEWMSAGPRDGSRVKLLLPYRNRGTVTGSGVVTLQPGSHLRVDSTSPAADVVSDGMHWNVRSLAPGDSGLITIWGTMTFPEATLQPFCIESSITATQDGAPGAVDTYPADNAASVCYTMAASAAIATKRGATPAGKDADGPITRRDSALTYTVTFRNVGNTPTSRVFLIDTLDANLDVASIQVLRSSNSWYRLDSPPWVLWVEFGNILLTDSTTSPSQSDGSITFSVRLRSGIATGSRITNQAYVIFDDNVPVATNAVVSTIVPDGAAVPGQSPSTALTPTVAPNPARERVMLDGLEPGAEIELWSATGSRIGTVRASGVTETIDIDDLASGEYLIVVSTRDGARTLPLVVTH
jgi:uncharacterized repeat protein (TIGR01451 family)